MTLTPIAERLAVELSLPVLRLRSVQSTLNTQPSTLQGERSNLLRHRRGSDRRRTDRQTDRQTNKVKPIYSQISFAEGI